MLSIFQVVDINPLGSIKTAMKRIPPGWETAWIPSECISLSDALNAYGKLNFFNLQLIANCSCMWEFQFQTRIIDCQMPHIKKDAGACFILQIAL